MEVIQPLHALSVHREMELLGVMVIVYGLMDNVVLKQEIKLVVEVIQLSHALSVQMEMELLGVMVIAYGLMKNVF